MIQEQAQEMYTFQRRVIRMQIMITMVVLRQKPARTTQTAYWPHGLAERMERRHQRATLHLSTLTVTRRMRMYIQDPHHAQQQTVAMAVLTTTVAVPVPSAVAHSIACM